MRPRRSTQPSGVCRPCFESCFHTARPRRSRSGSPLLLLLNRSKAQFRLNPISLLLALLLSSLAVARGRPLLLVAPCGLILLALLGLTGLAIGAPPAPKTGWGSLGMVHPPARQRMAVHQPKKRTIFRPSKKAVPKLQGQTSIFDLCSTKKKDEAEGPEDCK